MWNSNLVKTQPEASGSRDASRDDNATKPERRTTSGTTDERFDEEYAVQLLSQATGRIKRLQTEYRLLAPDVMGAAKAGLGMLVTPHEPRRWEDWCVFDDIGSHSLWVCLDPVR